MTPEACKSAREKLGWSREELGRRAAGKSKGVERDIPIHVRLIELYETGPGWNPTGRNFRVKKLERAFKAAGVQFGKGGELVEDEEPGK